MKKQEESKEIGDVCKALARASIAKAKARAKNGPGEAELNDSCNGLMNHMAQEAGRGKASCSFQFADPVLQKAVFGAAKKWKGCTAKSVGDLIVMEWGV